MDELRDEDDWSLVLPPRLKVAIADALNVHGHIENLAVELLWMLSSATAAQQKKIAGTTPNKNFAALKEVLAARGVITADAMWRDLTQLRKDRNLIAHGAWSVVNGSEPYVLWRQQRTGSLDRSELFKYDYERFGWFMRQGLQFLRMFSDLKVQIEAGNVP